jgi:hypothetical protein
VNQAPYAGSTATLTGADVYTKSTAFVLLRLDFGVSSQVHP